MVRQLERLLSFSTILKMLIWLITKRTNSTLAVASLSCSWFLQKNTKTFKLTLVKETLIDPEVAEEVEVVNLKVEEVEVLVVAVVAEVEGIMPIGVEQMRKALSEEVEDIILLEEAISEAVKAHHLILYPNMMIKMMSMVKTLIIKIIRRYNSRSHSRSLQDLFVLQTTSLRKTRKLA
jgi:hypothetical protein